MVQLKSWLLKLYICHLTWLIITKYLYQSDHGYVSFLFMTYHQVFSISDMTGATNVTETAYLSGVHWFTSGFVVGFVFFNLRFSSNVLWTIVVLCRLTWILYILASSKLRNPCCFLAISQPGVSTSSRPMKTKLFYIESTENSIAFYLE